VATNNNRQIGVEDNADRPASTHIPADVLRTGPPLAWWQLQITIIIDSYKAQIEREKKMLDEISALLGAISLRKELEHTILEKSIFICRLQELIAWAHDYKPDV